MPEYDRENFDPSAPVAHVTLRHPATGATLSDVLMLLDTGADVTFLPREAIEQLGIEPVDDKVYEVEDFAGETKFVEAAQLELLFLGRKFKGQFLLTEQPMGILGRNILNSIRLILDGPLAHWDEA